jgi:hypothetical protein
MPADLVVEFGKELNQDGFRYYPEQNSWRPSNITQYEFYSSTDGKSWKKRSEGKVFEHQKQSFVAKQNI